MEILTTTSQIREKIRWVLGNDRDERIALVAFVGGNADSFVDNPEGLRLYCWLKIPGTNPNGLRNLQQKGADLFAVDNLHMKVYWSRRRGAVIGSANLSNDALGQGEHTLHELAVYIPVGELDAGLLVKRLTATPIDTSTIDRFEQRYNLYRLRNKERSIRRTTSRHPLPPRSFLEWCEVGGPPWRLFWWREDAYPPKDAVDTVERETGSRYYRRYISSDSKNHYELGGWVLNFKESRYANEDIRPVYLSWFIPQVYSTTRNKEWRDYPHLWFQVGTQLPQVPFNLEDKAFQKALSRAIVQLGGSVEKVVKHGTRPTEQFLHALEERYLEITAT